MADSHTDHDAPHIRGEMDIHEQAASYALFGRLTRWGSLITSVGLLFFVLWFAVPGGNFFTALVVSVIVSIIGFYILKPKPGAH